MRSLGDPETKLEKRDDIHLSLAATDAWREVADVHRVYRRNLTQFRVFKNKWQHRERNRMKHVQELCSMFRQLLCCHWDLCIVSVASDDDLILISDYWFIGIWDASQFYHLASNGRMCVDGSLEIIKEQQLMREFHFRLDPCFLFQAITLDNKLRRSSGNDKVLLCSTEQAGI